MFQKTFIFFTLLLHQGSRVITNYPMQTQDKAKGMHAKYAERVDIP